MGKFLTASLPLPLHPFSPPQPIHISRAYTQFQEGRKREGGGGGMVLHANAINTHPLLLLLSTHSGQELQKILKEL